MDLVIFFGNILNDTFIPPMPFHFIYEFKSSFSYSKSIKKNSGKKRMNEITIKSLSEIVMFYENKKI